MRRIGSWLVVFLAFGQLAFAASCSDDSSETTSTGGVAGGGATAGEGGSSGGAGGAEPFEIDPERIYADAAWLAHLDRQGRDPATAGNEASLDYVTTLFGELGLEPVGDQDSYRQAFSFDRWVQSAPSTVAIDGTALTAGSQFLTGGYSGSVDLTGDLVFVGYGMSVPAFDAGQYPQCPLDPGGFDEFAAVDLTGRIAVVLRHGPNDAQAIHDHCPGGSVCVSEPCVWNFGYKVANARQHGASAVLIAPDYRHAADDIISPHLGEEYYHSDVAALMVDRATLEAALPDLQTWADAIDTTLQPNSQVTTVSASVSTSTTVSTDQTSNLLGAVRGTDPVLADEVIVVGAHIDHLGVYLDTGDVHPGADDNASGSAVMMELARALVGSHIEPARTVLFASWNAEEIGLIGSLHYVSEPAFPIGQTLMAFSIDMVGAGNESGLDVFGGTDPDYQWLLDVMVGSALDAGLTGSVRAVNPSEASDHASFVWGGAQGVLISTSGTHGYYHTPEDTADHITAANLGVAARLMWAGLETLAAGNEASFTTSARSGSAQPAARAVAMDPRSRVR